MACAFAIIRRIVSASTDVRWYGPTPATFCVTHNLSAQPQVPTPASSEIRAAAGLTQLQREWCELRVQQQQQQQHHHQQSTSSCDQQVGGEEPSAGQAPPGAAACILAHQQLRREDDAEDWEHEEWEQQQQQQQRAHSRQQQCPGADDRAAAAAPAPATTPQQGACSQGADGSPGAIGWFKKCRCEGRGRYGTNAKCRSSLGS
jgi:hypothetical protein